MPLGALSRLLYPAVMTHRAMPLLPRARALGALLGGMLGGLLACSHPTIERVAPAPERSREVAPAASSPGALRSAEPTPVVLAASSSPVASASSAAAPSASAPVYPEEPDEKTLEAQLAAEEKRKLKARGQCSGWDKLQTKQGEVNCYPYRCRGDRCLTRCQNRQDCAGSLGPGDLAEHGWPLDCAAAGTCFPLPPSHVRRP